MFENNYFESFLPVVTNFVIPVPSEIAQGSLHNTKNIKSSVKKKYYFSYKYYIMPRLHYI
jgi:hypothetical protein